MKADASGGGNEVDSELMLADESDERQPSGDTRKRESPWQQFYARLLTQRGRKTALWTASIAGVLLLAHFFAGGYVAPITGYVLPFVVITVGVLMLQWRGTFDELETEQETVARLRKLEKEYALAERLGTLGSWTYDVPRDRYHWSPGTFELFGVDPEIGAPSRRGFFICIHPEDQERWQNALRRSIRDGDTLDVEFRYVRHGRETIWVRGVARPEKDRTGRVARLTGIAQDTTVARAMAQKLAAREALFRDLTQMSTDWTWETDAAHRLKYISGAAVTELGGNWVNSLIGKHLWDVPSLDMPKVDWDGFRKLIEAHGSFENFEYTRTDPAGNLLTISITGRAHFDKDGHFGGYRGVGRNATADRQRQTLLQVESELAQLVRELTDPQEVVLGLIARVNALMGWIGGLHLVSDDDGQTLHVRERNGIVEFTTIVGQLPQTISLTETSLEARSWAAGKALWVQRVAGHAEFAGRYHTDQMGIQAALITPIFDQRSKVVSQLLFFSRLGFKADHFMAQFGETVSRTLSLYLQRKSAENKLMHASLHDALTGLPNRVYLTHQLETRLAKNDSVAVLYVDLDRYKIINDTLGHAAGDQVLVEVARRLRDTIRPTDLAGRMGGDEFIVLLSEAYDPDDVESTARRILAAIEKPFVLAGRAHFLSASIGVAMSMRDGTDAKLLIKCADNAMYRVKSEGRNGVRFFAAELADERSAQMQLASELPEALRRGEIDVYYQPILSIASRQLAGIEALLRWHHPIHGLMTADKFIPIAEQSNLIKELGTWVIRRAIDDRLTLGLDRYEAAPVAVNVSARQLNDDDFLAQLNTLLAERQFPAGMLRLELTESSFIENPERTIKLLAEIRRLGVAIIIDNFGTGYASLAYLKNLPVDGLKIDRSFVNKLADDRGNSAIVQAITTLARKLGVIAMAEGVQEQSELSELRKLDCDIVQGELISEPLGLNQLKEFLQTLPALRQMHQPGQPPAKTVAIR